MFAELRGVNYCDANFFPQQLFCLLLYSQANLHAQPVPCLSCALQAACRLLHKWSRPPCGIATKKKNRKAASNRSDRMRIWTRQLELVDKVPFWAVCFFSPRFTKKMFFILIRSSKATTDCTDSSLVFKNVRLYIVFFSQCSATSPSSEHPVN